MESFNDIDAGDNFEVDIPSDNDILNDTSSNQPYMPGRQKEKIKNPYLEGGYDIKADMKKNNLVKGMFDTINKISGGGKIKTHGNKAPELNETEQSEAIVDVNMVIVNMESCVEYLEDPSIWLPAGKENMSEKLKTVYAPVVKALNNYIKFLKKME